MCQLIDLVADVVRVSPKLRIIKKFGQSATVPTKLQCFKSTTKRTGRIDLASMSTPVGDTCAESTG